MHFSKTTFKFWLAVVMVLGFIIVLVLRSIIGVTIDKALTYVYEFLGFRGFIITLINVFIGLPLAFYYFYSWYKRLRGR